MILRKLSEGATKDELLDAYPRLNVEEIQAAVGYAADTLAREETIILAPPKKRARKEKTGWLYFQFTMSPITAKIRE